MVIKLSISCNQILTAQKMTVCWVFSFALSRISSLPRFQLWWRGDTRRRKILWRLEGCFCSQFSGHWEFRTEARHRPHQPSTQGSVLLLSLLLGKQCQVLLLRCGLEEMARAGGTGLNACAWNLGEKKCSNVLIASFNNGGWQRRHSSAPGVATPRESQILKRWCTKDPINNQHLITPWSLKIHRTLLGMVVTLSIPGRQKQADLHELEASLVYIVRSCLKKSKAKQIAGIVTPHP